MWDIRREALKLNPFSFNMLFILYYYRTGIWRANINCISFHFIIYILNLAEPAPRGRIINSVKPLEEALIFHEHKVISLILLYIISLFIPPEMSMED